MFGWRKPVINAQGHLMLGGCDAVALAEEFGTPLYVMEEDKIRDVCKQYTSALEASGICGQIQYASKAFHNMAICRIIDQEGMGLDVVSGGELYGALKAGFPAEKIYMHGNNKTDAELFMAISEGVGRIVIDSYDEIAVIGGIAEKLGKKALVSVRVKPGVEAHTHEYIKTGSVDSKFGLGISDGTGLEAIKAIAANKNLGFKGLHCHIGSQIFELEPFDMTVDVMTDYMKTIQNELGLKVDEIDFGGGYGIYYTDEDTPLKPVDYMNFMINSLKKHCANKGLELPFFLAEPGRSIVGEAGTTLYTIGTTKEIPNIRKYISVDGGMADNPRPALYQAEYSCLIANKANKDGEEKVSIAGRCCESGDMLAADIMLPRAERGDVLAVFSTGAYNYAMASNYNKLPIPAVVFAKDGKAEVVTARQTYESMHQGDTLPSWIR